VAAAPSKGVLGNIGALLLEDLVQAHPSMHARVVSRAKRDKKFRRCLSFVRTDYLTPEMRAIAGGVP
jgi:hypothetical protein